MRSIASDRRGLLAGILLGRVKAASGMLVGAITKDKTLQGKAQKIYNLACELERALHDHPEVLESVAVTQLTKDKKGRRNA